jgi:hypothetical protein
VKATLGQTVYDPCCGTAGFVAIAYEHIACNLGSSPLSTDIETLKHDTFFGRDVDLHPEVTWVFHRELTRLKVMFCGLCWGQDMCCLPFRSGYC